MNTKILLVDDDPDILTLLVDRLESYGYRTATASDGANALEVIAQDPPDLVLLDLEMPRLSGLELLKTLGSPGARPKNTPSPSELPIIVMTAHGTISVAVEAMKFGAYDFVTKPFDMDHLSLVIGKTLERESLKREVEYLRGEVDSRYGKVIGSSPNFTAVLDGAQRAAKSNVNVLLLGESGTGKELFARSLHQWSPRRTHPFVVINCVALQDTLLENELFGHEKGAFTGADRMEKGKIERADGGTLFLDEIGDMPLPLQAKLLRVLQDREFQRVGGTRNIHVNIRVIAATNTNLAQAVKSGRFREDLFYRLNVVSLTLPPLRTRRGDIPALAEAFLLRHAKEAKKSTIRLSPAACKALTEHSWPGNIRELDNTIARAVVLTLHDTITPEELALPTVDPAGASTLEKEDQQYMNLPYHESMEQHSQILILRALRFERGNQTKAAQRLQLQRTYLARLIKQKNLPLDR